MNRLKEIALEILQEKVNNLAAANKRVVFGCAGNVVKCRVINRFGYTVKPLEGVAKCSPNDTFILAVGQAIALTRALGDRMNLELYGNVGSAQPGTPAADQEIPKVAWGAPRTRTQTTISSGETERPNRMSDEERERIILDINSKLNDVLASMTAMNNALLAMLAPSKNK